MTNVITLHYDYAFQSVKGIIHATTNDGRVACGLNGALIVNSSYRHVGYWSSEYDNACGLCKRHLEKEAE